MPAARWPAIRRVRAVTLTAIPTHLVADIRFGRYDTNEMVYAKDLLPEIPDDP
ncbi:transposase [Ralstonia solanacearum]|nr:transposase [Ralstonia solanacearum]